ncbi:MAG: hypothetical protein M3R00_04740 [Pseudomonadota bacterium]|nr:hypothetical protein [Pseudomonadota bacterium]
MFSNKNEIRYYVGAPIPTIEYDWFAPTTNYRKRGKIYGSEILQAFQIDMPNPKENLEEAKSSANDTTKQYLRDNPSNCAFMEYECPIFEVSGTEIIRVHFRCNLFTYDYLCSDHEPSYTCQIL